MIVQARGGRRLGGVAFVAVCDHSCEPRLPLSRGVEIGHLVVAKQACEVGHRPAEAELHLDVFSSNFGQRCEVVLKDRIS